eukprot:TRINITY_DN5980_c0_g1_i2.p2 TRINITY_DN5980_c0_g1~~TRINITY_DN5980_c0_g1_i2.p2  ORF type:complete len:213 (-),score=18.44 TRINITY_DN5980_c0_g1_i2:247-885(-)
MAVWHPDETLLRYEPPVRKETATRSVSTLTAAIQNQLLPLDQKHPIIVDHPTDILDAALPPRDLDDGMVQYVSRQAATRADVIALAQSFDTLLVRRKSRLRGLCAVRSDCYSQLFDEILRQCLLEDPDRGLLLLRIRNEMRMRIAAYRVLYETTSQHGLAQAVAAEVGRPELEAEISEVEKGPLHSSGCEGSFVMRRRGNRGCGLWAVDRGL